MCGYVPGVNGPADLELADGGAPLEVLVSAPTERVLESPALGGHILLAVDTALGSSVAVSHDGRIFEVSHDDMRGHAEVIGDLIEKVFALAEIAPDAVTGVVAGIGPGPFTGLRIGIAAAQAFATGRGVPLLPMHSHDAVALAVLGRGAAPAFRVVQDAKRRELFVSEYSGLDWAGMPLRGADARIERRDEFSDAAADVWPERIPAAQLVRIAASKLITGGHFDEPQALYLRDPDVYPAATPKRVSS